MRVWLGAVLAATVAAAAGAAAVPGRATVTVSVTTDRFVFPDRLHRASYRIACGSSCPRPRASADVDVKGRTVRQARLGFAASRDSVPRPPAAVPTPGVTEQDESVSVVLTEAGDLDVTLTAATVGTVDATPMAGTASSGGSIRGRTVHWRVARAEPGAYEFAVRLRVTSDPAQPVAYVPRTEISRKATSRDLLAYANGSQRAPSPVERVSTVMFQARVAPAYGTPRSRPGPWYVLADRWRLPVEFEGSASVDAYGDYSAAASGRTGAETEYRLPHDAVGVVNGGTIGTASAYAVGEPKASPHLWINTDPEWGVPGARYALCVDPPDPYEIFGPAGDRLHDRDAVQGSAQGTFGVYRADRKGLPRGSRGKLGGVWPGQFASGWYQTWGTNASGVLRGSQPGGPETLGLGVGRAAAIQWQVTGGDVDNRNGGGAVRGRGVRLTVPDKERIGFVFVLTFILPHTNLSLDFDVNGRTVAMTPVIEAGGYWLRSNTSAPKKLDWVTDSSVYIDTSLDDAGTGGGAPVVTRQVLALVPPGIHGDITTIAADGTLQRTRIGSGVWQVTSAPGRLDVVPFRPEQSACPGSVAVPVSRAGTKSLPA